MCFGTPDLNTIVHCSKTKAHKGQNQNNGKFHDKRLTLGFRQITAKLSMNELNLISDAFANAIYSVEWTAIALILSQKQNYAKFVEFYLSSWHCFLCVVVISSESNLFVLQYSLNCVISCDLEFHWLMSGSHSLTHSFFGIFHSNRSICSWKYYYEIYLFLRFSKPRIAESIFRLDCIVQSLGCSRFKWIRYNGYFKCVIQHTSSTFVCK